MPNQSYGSDATRALFERRNPEALVLRGLVVRRARLVMRRPDGLVPQARWRLTVERHAHVHPFDRQPIAEGA